MSDKPIEAEVVETNQAVAVRPSGGVATIQDMDQAFALAVHQRELLSDYIKKQLKPGQHFYQRGEQKPSLSKEGAEIILLPHGLVPDYEMVSGPSEPPTGDQPYQITIKCILRHKGDPTSFFGSGIGSAGSHKGFWNKKTNSWDYQQRQTDRFLCHNATLKMAQKSAMIAATINSTAASEFFTQDMDEAGSNAPSATAAPATKPSKTTVAAPAAATPDKPKEKKDSWRKAFIDNIPKDQHQNAIRFMIDLGWLMANEGLESVSLTWVPESKDQMQAFLNCLQQYVDDGRVIVPYGPAAAKRPEPDKNVPRGTIEVPRDKNIDCNSPDAPWRKFPVPFGKHAGKALADLDKNVLYGFWLNFKVEEEWTDKNGRVHQTKPDKLAKDQKFKEMLIEAGSHYEFSEPEEEDDLNYK